VVLQLLRLLTECGCADWQQAAAIQGAAGAGAGLAALYSCCIPLPKGAAALGAILAPPDSPGGTIQVRRPTCEWHHSWLRLATPTAHQQKPHCVCATCRPSAACAARVCVVLCHG
jgi:hypothetical protein